MILADGGITHYAKAWAICYHRSAAAPTCLFVCFPLYIKSLHVYSDMILMLSSGYGSYLFVFFTLIWALLTIRGPLAIEGWPVGRGRQSKHKSNSHYHAKIFFFMFLLFDA